MYKRTSESKDWLERTGSSATRPVLAANINPAPLDLHEVGRLAELRDEAVRLRKQLGVTPPGRQHPIQMRLAAIRPEIKRLNRLVNDHDERQTLWTAMRNVLSHDQIRAVSDEAQRLRIEAGEHLFRGR